MPPHSDAPDLAGREHSCNDCVLFSLSRRFERRQLDPDLFRLSMDRRDIANYLGLTIETVSRTLSALQRDGVIHVKGKNVRILDRQALSELAHWEESSGSRQAVG